MAEPINRWEIETAAWDAALDAVDYKGSHVEEADSLLKKFVKRKSCAGTPNEYCNEMLQSAIKVAICSIKFMRFRRYQYPGTVYLF